MSDRRLTPANERVAASHLRGQVQADTFVDGAPATIKGVVVDLCARPAGKRDRQLLLGAAVAVYERLDGWAFVQSKRDGYVGYIPETTLGAPKTTTHRVSSPATHAYETESFKSRDLLHLPFGAEVEIVSELHKFFETPLGFIPKKHLRPVDQLFTDPATVAQLFFGVPYLWGGNSTRGIDCSGLVQASYHACGHLCAGDSDMQADGLGRALNTDEPLQRGDLIFWKGHVAMMVDAETMIHANAHHMAVVYEGLSQATLRIKAQGDGEITAKRRVL
ncbi:NlpC/P60 family protein [Octadecabacter temperatus]|uniref:Gamma-D-glutamyl-L-lysine endopeptidase n=1 Tax=Octadecabacter temperatus TaxID=1458307 RepID=A0A0K0Y198_9RHOB|nr:NlpC/P60 family protein [Octadecabacter temperatus]AKS44671.1 Gamma-D-glutamyl-L-lysine endopeptidase [Octadecabacter temperatus]SIO36704.1 NlpC/P60 family protein [Octadecabacter temperatus]